MKILYLKNYTWLLPETTSNDFFGYRRYQVLATHIKASLKKH